ncbi:myelin-oligodendrocyte glycoprotein-like isoform X2 [Hemibagrus wyckioides]|uniref:myelin-oligodendrocyte glycoprotein-like isoform X2 n=1 Tax=Hemibagrus wyckioides TaxID=337641 RepID=UPI00266D8DE6|nr:myelin-oligodendrocyte glycoprotein-like isoform X2 [Hemibagrus wyckioides]
MQCYRELHALSQTICVLETQGLMDSVNFLFIYITWLITSVDSQVISARVGSTVVLPCDLSGLPKPSMYIQWRTDFDVVFERSRRESYQGERYKGRVNVPEEHLFKGNCSLVLRNVEFNDAGVYYTYLFMKRSKRSIARFIQRVKLKVYDAGPTLSLPFLVFSLIVCLLYFVLYIVKNKIIQIKISKHYVL